MLYNVWDISSCSSVSKESTCNVGDLSLIPGLGRSPEGGHGNPHQHSCLENPMDRGAWWAAVCGVAKCQTRLSDWARQFPDQGLDLWPLHWQHGVLTTGLPEKSQDCISKDGMMEPAIYMIKITVFRGSRQCFDCLRRVFPASSVTCQQLHLSPLLHCREDRGLAVKNCGLSETGQALRLRGEYNTSCVFVRQVSSSFSLTFS